MLQVKDISVIYPNGVKALEEVSLTSVRGQFVVLLGVSGAGKSTLLRCLNGLATRSRGSVSADDVGSLDQSRALRAHRRRTGMIFQNHHLIGRQTALRNVLMGRLGYHSAWRTLFPLPLPERRLALECLGRVGLLEKAEQRADNLSGGERQRVGIARALVQQPRLILADEPVASLDPVTAGRVLGLLHRICREDGLTSIISLHQCDLAKVYADRIVGLNQGRIVFDGAPDKLLSSDLEAIYPSSAVSGPENSSRRNGPVFPPDLAPPVDNHP